VATELSFDILRQGSGVDLWCWVGGLAGVVLAAEALLAGREEPSRSRTLRRALAVFGAAGSVIVLALFRTPLVGLIWTTVVLLLVSVAFYLRQRDRLPSRRLSILLLARSIAVVLAVPMLFEPVVRLVTSRQPDRPLVLVVDRSASMSVPDVQNGPSRLEAATMALRPAMERLSRHFAVRVVAFGASAEPIDGVDALASLEPADLASDIVAGVREAASLEPRGDGAVVLLSDGIDNRSSDVVAAVGELRRTVHTVRVGSEQVEPAKLVNVAVDRVEAADDFVVNAEGKLAVTIRSAALASRVIDVKLAALDEQGAVLGEVQTRSLVLDPSAGGQTVQMSHRPRRVGVQKLAVWVDPIPGERSVADNRQELQVLALDPRIRVLYVEGRARPEYRELARALGRDPSIELATLLRVQQDRFTASGTVDGEPLRAVPGDDEQWGRFDVILLGDLDASFLGERQQRAIEQQVLGGKGLAMIGGQNAFGPGGYANTPIERALPVSVGERTASQEKTEFVPTLTPEGTSHPAMDGLGEWFPQAGASSPPAKQLPTLLGNVVVGPAKAGAAVLLVHAARPNPQGSPQIILATHRYGEGRAAAFTADTTYRWYLPMRGLGQDSPYNRFWGQLVRWLAGADVRDRARGGGAEVLLDQSTYRLGEAVRVRAFVRDERGDATRFAQVSLTLRPRGADASNAAEPTQQSLAPSEGRNGMYEATLPGVASGEWTVEVVAAKDGTELARKSLAFGVLPPQDEMLNLAADADRLDAIARRTGGYAHTLAQLPQLVESLIRAGGDTTLTEQRTVPVHNAARVALALRGHYPQWPGAWDLPMQASLVVLLLALEWLLRRAWSMP
jgi:uncharacterized membrane protein